MKGLPWPGSCSLIQVSTPPLPSPHSIVMLTYLHSPMGHPFLRFGCIWGHSLPLECLCPTHAMLTTPGRQHSAQASPLFESFSSSLAPSYLHLSLPLPSHSGPKRDDFTVLPESPLHVSFRAYNTLVSVYFSFCLHPIIMGSSYPYGSSVVRTAYLWIPKAWHPVWTAQVCTIRNFLLSKGMQVFIFLSPCSLILETWLQCPLKNHFCCSLFMGFAWGWSHLWRQDWDHIGSRQLPFSTHLPHVTHDLGLEI